LRKGARRDGCQDIRRRQRIGGSACPCPCPSPPPPRLRSRPGRIGASACPCVRARLGLARPIRAATVTPGTGRRESAPFGISAKQYCL